MALFNYATRELSAKIVYYGPGLSGKTTNIEMVHKILRPDQKGRLISLPTETDRTLFFDFLPLDLGQIKGFRVRFHLYTVPGQVFYNATRKLVLQGVDGVVFVADSQKGMSDSNVESLQNLTDNLASYGKRIEELPFVLQYNKRDLRNIATVKELDLLLNPRKVPTFPAVAKDGVGVAETLVAISRTVFSHLRRSLLLPGESEEIGDLADTRIRKSFGGEAEALEEISEIDEIPEAGEVPAAGEIAAIPEIAESEGISDLREFTGGGEAAGAPGISDLQEIEAAGGFSGAGETAEFPETPGAEAPAGAEGPYAAEGAGWVPEEVELEIEIPEPPPSGPEPPAAEPPPRGTPSVSVSAEGEELTFLKFEEVRLTPEGHALLPALFLDASGTPVRIRIRIAVDEGGG